MPRPELARAFLNLVLNLTLLIIVIFTIKLVWDFAHLPPGTLNIAVPASLGIRFQGQTFRITEVLQTIPQPPGWGHLLFFAYALGLLSLLFVGYLRLKTFVNRLFLDPFDQANIRDLRFATVLALLWQGGTGLVALVNWTTAHRMQAYGTLQGALNGVPQMEVLGSATNTNFASVNLLGVLGIDFTPLVVAAALVILAAVLQQASTVRREERRLRQEQELTV